MRARLRVGQIGWRYRHVNWPRWALVEKLPMWLIKYIKGWTQLKNKYWIVERLYVK